MAGSNLKISESKKPGSRRAFFLSRMRGETLMSKSFWGLSEKFPTQINFQNNEQ
jgi:hypothetical protein